MRIFLAGAAGVIGRNLIPLLVRDGHTITGTTRSGAKSGQIKSLGAKPAILDVFDDIAVMETVTAARPEVVIHQITDLPQEADAEKLAASRDANARLRIEGTRNLMAAAKAAGVKRVIAQSVAFVYAPGKKPHDEADPLDADKNARRTVEGIVALEEAVTKTRGVEGIILRYGRFYGPGTWAVKPTGKGFVHVEAAAQAAALAVTRGKPGVYNIAEDDGELNIARARKAFGFDPKFRATA